MVETVKQIEFFQGHYQLPLTQPSRAKGTPLLKGFLVWRDPGSFFWEVRAAGNQNIDGSFLKHDAFCYWSKMCFKKQPCGYKLKYTPVLACFLLLWLNIWSKATWGGKDLSYRLQSIKGGQIRDQGRNLETGTDERPWRNLACWLVPHSLLSLPSYIQDQGHWERGQAGAKDIT